MAFPSLTNMECSETTTHKYSTPNNVYSYIEINLICSNKLMSVCLKNPKIFFYGLYFSFILYYSAF